MSSADADVIARLPLPASEPPRVSYPEATRAFARIAALSFGGPAGQIAVMHRILVEEKRWVSEDRFLHALNYCMLLPGPEAQQLATYVGWLLHGWRGGLMAGGLFILPGFVSILALSILYALLGNTTLVAGVFFGLKAAVLAIVVEAVIRIGKRALRNRVMVVLAAAAFVGIYFLEVPFPLIVLAAGLIGFIGGRVWPSSFHVIKGPAGDEAEARLDAGVEPSAARVAKVLAIWLPLWFGPVALLWAWLGRGHVLTEMGVFFSQVALFTVGGAYAALAYVAQQAVDAYGWLQPGEMLDGLGMAETTPGPLIMVLQFVGFMGAYRQAEPFPPLLAAVLGAVITTWVTFAPCFLWIFLGAPYIERLRGHAGISSALSAITAAVVGVILNLAVWFALHVLFAVVNERHEGPVRLLVPDTATLDLSAALIAIAAFVMLLRLKWGMVRTLVACTAVGLMAYAARMGVA